MGNNNLNPQQWAFGFISGIVMAGSRTLAITLTVFSRHRFGDRYFTFGTFLSGFIGLWLVNAISSLMGIANMLTGGFASLLGGFFGYEEPVSFFGNILPLYVAVSAYHFASRWLRARKGEVWWGWSTGVPWLGLLRKFDIVRENKILNWLTSEWTLFLYVEPLLFFLLGQAFGIILHDKFMSAWLFGGSIGLAWNNHGLVSEQKERLKDMRDAQIQSQYLADALAGRDKELTHGFAHLPVHAKQHEFFFGKQAANDNQPKAVQLTIDEVVAETMQNRASDDDPPMVASKVA